MTLGYPRSNTVWGLKGQKSTLWLGYSSSAWVRTLRVPSSCDVVHRTRARRQGMHAAACDEVYQHHQAHHHHQAQQLHHRRTLSTPPPPSSSSSVTAAGHRGAGGARLMAYPDNSPDWFSIVPSLTALDSPASVSTSVCNDLEHYCLQKQ